ncbi:hypothetical protein GCM10027511_15000 [Hymenobacter humi]
MNYPSLKTSAPRLFQNAAELATATRYGSHAHQRPTGYIQPNMSREAGQLLLDDTLTEAAGLARNYGSEMDAYAGSY